LATDDREKVFFQSLRLLKIEKSEFTDRTAVVSWEVLNADRTKY
jgi:hypothetical protein